MKIPKTSLLLIITVVTIFFIRIDSMNKRLIEKSYYQADYIEQMEKVIFDRNLELTKIASLNVKILNNEDTLLTLHYKHTLNKFFFYEGATLQYYNDQTGLWESERMMCGTGIFPYPLVRKKSEWKRSTPSKPGRYRYAVYLGYPIRYNDPKSYYKRSFVAPIDVIYSNVFTIKNKS